MRSALTRNESTSFRLFIFTMVAPAVVLVAAFILAPLLLGLFTSFYRTNGFVRTIFVGMDNYRYAIEDAVFRKAISNTVYFAVFVTVAKNVLALLLAIILAKNIRGGTLFRVAAFIPVTFSFIVTGVLWSWIYSPVFGILNEGLILLGADHLIRNWLSDPQIAMTSIAVVDVWKWTGFHMVIYLSGIQKIPTELFESASIDGANSWNQFRYITVPQLNATIVLNVLLSFTGAFVNNYDLVTVMTGGGPFNSTEVALTYITKTLFKFLNVGKANAMTVLLVIFVSVFGFIQLKTMTKEDVYE